MSILIRKPPNIEPIFNKNTIYNQAIKHYNKQTSKERKKKIYIYINSNRRLNLDILTLRSSPQDLRFIRGKRRGKLRLINLIKYFLYVAILLQRGKRGMC